MLDLGEAWEHSETMTLPPEEKSGLNRAAGLHLSTKNRPTQSKRCYRDKNLTMAVGLPPSHNFLILCVSKQNLKA